MLVSRRDVRFRPKADVRKMGRSRMRVLKSKIFIALLAALGMLATSRLCAAASGVPSALPDKIDQAVIESIPVWKGNQAKIVDHLDLTTPFATSSQWTFVLAQDQTPPSEELPSGDDGHGPLAICFVKVLSPQCTESQIGTGNMSWYTDVYELMEDKIVYTGSGNARPLLWLKTCSTASGDGDCGVRVTLFEYDLKQDHFTSVFFYDAGGKNNNNNARYIEDGPLRGDVIVDHPTEKAPFTYVIEVYGRGKSGPYSQILKYRGHTGYGDGNELPVAYSEMPEILRRLGLWHPGDPLPIPPNTACEQPTLRHGEEWCQ